VRGKPSWFASHIERTPLDVQLTILQETWRESRPVAHIHFHAGRLSATTSITSVKLDSSAEERGPKLLVQTDELVGYAKFSPDTRWILYKAQPRDQRRGGIYVQPFPDPGLRKQIASATRALSPVWRADGKEILYYDDNHIWSVGVEKVWGGVALQLTRGALLCSRAPLRHTGFHCVGCFARRLSNLLLAIG
jgi:hypothetical protein